MSRPDAELTDAQWDNSAPLWPEPKPSPRGGPNPTPNRRCFEGILWMWRTGARWKDLPPPSPSPRTCWRRRRDGEEQDGWLKAWRGLLARLDAHGQLTWAAACADGRFAPAQTGARRGARPRGGKARGGGWWSAAEVFLWETSWPRRPRPR
jgi:transposase